MFASVCLIHDMFDKTWEFETTKTMMFVLCVLLFKWCRGLRSCQCIEYTHCESGAMTPVHIIFVACYNLFVVIVLLFIDLVFLLLLCDGDFDGGNDDDDDVIL